jgi:hypothetical protein
MTGMIQQIAASFMHEDCPLPLLRAGRRMRQHQAKFINNRKLCSAKVAQ